MAQAAVGTSMASLSFNAGYDAAVKAKEGLNSKPCHLAMVFATSKHNAVELHHGVREAVGHSVQIFGGAAAGVAAHGFLSYGGFEVAVALFSWDAEDSKVFLSKDLIERGEESVGRDLARQLSVSGEPVPLSSLFLMYDSVRGEPGRPLNMATPLIQGLSHDWGNVCPSLVGVGAMGDMQFGRGFIMANEEVTDQAATLLAFPKSVRLDTHIVHGCKPASDYHTITKVDGAVVLEIDGRPAIDMVTELLNGQPNITWEDYPLYVTLGVNRGDPYEFREENYANRLCMAVDRERGGLVMFEPDLKAGDRIQLMRRTVDMGYVQERIQHALESVHDRKVIAVIYVNCLGRASAYSGSEKEDVAEVQRFVPQNVPFLGIYSGVEVSRVGDQLQALDWTGVIVVLSEEKDHGRLQ